jgi:multidrug efflux pump
MAEGGASDPSAPLFRVNGAKALGLAISMAASGNLLDFGSFWRATFLH